MPWITLGQSGSKSSMLFWVVVLIALALVGGLVIFNLRRRMLSQDDSISTSSSGLLDHISELHKSGQIDDDEFARARNAIIRRVQNEMETRKNQETAPNQAFLDGIDLDP